MNLSKYYLKEYQEKFLGHNYHARCFNCNKRLDSRDNWVVLEGYYELDKIIFCSYCFKELKNLIKLFTKSE